MYIYLYYGILKIIYYINIILIKNIIIVLIVFFNLTLNASIQDTFYSLDDLSLKNLLQQEYNNNSNDHITLCLYAGESDQIKKNFMHDLNIKYNNKKQIDKDYRETVLGLTIEKDKKNMVLLMDMA